MKDQQNFLKNRSFALVSFLFLTTFLTIRIFKKVNLGDIRIYGSNLFSIEDIVSNSSLNFPTPLILVKTTYAENELKKKLSLKNVSVTRQIFPFGLKIRVKTRVPAAYSEKNLNGTKITGFVDEGGFFINKKYSDQENIKQLPTKVIGWKENFRERLSKILKSQRNNDVEFVTINFSPSGFLTLEEKSLKTILLGFNPKIIDEQLQIITEIKNQLINNTLLKKIDNINLIDPKNPKIKVFKP